MPTFRPCLLIPTYNNQDSLPALLQRLAVFGHPCILVNDGSSPEARRVLEGCARTHDWLHLHHRAKNGGKGAAVKDGLRLAGDQGYTHALQIDADGQHESDDIPKFFAAAQREPAALVLGTPIFGPDVPKARLHGRKLSRFFVHLATLSRVIADPLFGFRVYPVAAAVDLIQTRKLGDRMDFDPEIAVRLVWAGLPVINLATPVSYPEGGISHFRLVRDNLKITWLHTRLVCGMVLRLPKRLWGMTS